MDNPVGYLYRVGQTRRPTRLWPVSFPAVARTDDVGGARWSAALASLTEHQRVATVLVHGRVVAAGRANLLGVKVTTVQNHVERGLQKLRAYLAVATDA